MQWNFRTQLYSFGIITLILASLIFWQGLSGGFILDDFPNLVLLSQLPQDASWSQMWTLATNGISGFLGRPLSMMSFLLQAESWPSNPFQFKLVNLLIHLINGALVLMLCVLIGANNSRFKLPAPLIALTVLLWLLHPMQIGNVLYVVQRMNLLSSLFILAGLCVYLWSRIRFIGSNKNIYLLLMVFSPAIAAVLGLLSKENGVLIYVFLATLELSLIWNEDASADLRKAKLLAVIFPLTIGLLAFLAYIPTALEGYNTKPFTLSERAYTQFPILMNYLFNIATPKMGVYSLFHDDFPIFSNLLSVETLISSLLVLGAMVFALFKWQKFPVVSFTILWFFLGHSLESTFLPLEMYFEHRNYLPILGPILGLVFSLNWVLKKWPENFTSLAAISCAATSWTVWVALQQSMLWGNALDHAYAEAQHRPESHRAQSNLVQTVTNLGDPVTGYELQSSLLDSDLVQFSDYIRALEFSCLLQNIEVPSPSLLQSQARVAHHDFSTISLLNNLINGIGRGACTAVPISSVDLVLAELANNEQFEISHPDLVQLRGLLNAFSGNFAQAAFFAGQSYGLRADIRVALLRITWLVEAGQLSEAMNTLEAFESIYASEITSRTGLANQLNAIRSRMQ